MAATVQRVPFGEVGASRLQALQSAKNRQNAITDMLKSPKLDKLSSFKSNIKSATFQLTSPSKRPASSMDDGNNSDSDHSSDGENVDPATVHTAKRSRVAEPVSKGSGYSSDLFQKPSVQLSSATATKRKYTAEPALSSISFLAPPSAPTGRVFAHPRVSLLSKKRTPLPSLKRIDPPSISFGRTNASVPFSIDAALSGTFAKPAPKKTSSLKKAQPDSWFFDIHEDSPDEEMAIVMEHSTGLIDLSSDDEEEPAAKKMRLDEEKENIAPGDYVQQARVRPVAINAMADNDCDGDRSPLSDLAPEEYFAAGCDKDSVTVLVEDAEEASEVRAETILEKREEETVVPKGKEIVEGGLTTEACSTALPPSESTFGFVIAEDPVDTHP